MRGSVQFIRPLAGAQIWSAVGEVYVPSLGNDRALNLSLSKNCWS
jgi:hypothetical protein